MHVRLVLVAVLALSGCIDSPTVELVDGPDASASSSPAPAPSPAPSPTTSSSSTPDATPPAPACDQAGCAVAGGTCTNDVCTITCTSQAKCEGNIKCPAGMPCSVSCTGKDACTKPVECKNATKCTIACTGESACKESLTCEGPECAITCQDKGCSADKVHCCATACTFNGLSLTCQ